MPESQPSYWDAFPKSIRQSYNPAGVSIPIRIEGQPSGALHFQSCDPSVATVENGWIHCGVQNGATMILVSDSSETVSVRHIQVEVFDPGPSYGYG